MTDDLHVLKLENRSGTHLTLTNVGASVMGLRVFGTDVVLGYDSPEAYLDNPAFLGIAVGRIANRIKGACFELNGETVFLEANEGKNHLHGGVTGLGRRVFSGCAEGNRAIFEYHSPHGEDRYPGTLDIRITYTLTDENELLMEYLAESDRPAYFAPTNHCYFNLNGHASGTINGHLLRFGADRFTETDMERIPTGKLLPAVNNVYDFRSARPIGSFPYDLNYVLTGNSPAALCRGEKSGIVMKLLTNMPGMQFYTADDLEAKGKNGAAYTARSGFCLEPQYFPNAVNTAGFLIPVTEPDRPFLAVNWYVFSREEI